MSTYYALRSTKENGYAKYVQFMGGVTPNAVQGLALSIEDGILFTKSQLNVIRKKLSTKELIEKHLTDFQLVSVDLSSLDLSKTVPFNINSEVKVKLTNFGIQVLKEKHNEVFGSLIERGMKEYEFQLQLDTNGYYKSQMWVIMKQFGEYIFATQPEYQVFESIEFLIPKNHKNMFLS